MFFGLLISLNISSGSIFASQAKARVYSDAIHDMETFQMLKNIKAHVAHLLTTNLLSEKITSQNIHSEGAWPRGIDGNNLELNESNFARYGQIYWIVDSTIDKTEQGFVLETYFHSNLYGIITPWGKFMPRVQFGGAKLTYNKSIYLENSLPVRFIEYSQREGYRYKRYEMLSIGDIALPSVVWRNEFCWQAFKFLEKRTNNNNII